MDCFNVRESREVPCVACENAFHSVDMHGGDKASIVDLDTGNRMIYQEFAPLAVNAKRIRQKRDSLLNCTSPTVARCRSEAKAISVNWPCENIPHFTQVLRCVAGIRPGLKEPIDRCLDQQLVGVVRLMPAQQNVAVKQYEHQ
jgi:hypothetical protein